MYFYYYYILLKTRKNVSKLARYKIIYTPKHHYGAENDDIRFAYVFVITTCPHYESNSSLWIQRYTRYDTQRQKQTERARERESVIEGRGGVILLIYTVKKKPQSHGLHTLVFPI